MSEIHKPHDHFVRKALSYRKVAIPFFTPELSDSHGDLGQPVGLGDPGTKAFQNARNTLRV